MVCLTFRLSSKSLLTSEDYDLGAGIRKRHKGSEEDQDALLGMGKARGRNQSWDDHESSSDFMSQVSKLSLADSLGHSPQPRGLEVIPETVNLFSGGLLVPAAVEKRLRTKFLAVGRKGRPRGRQGLGKVTGGRGRAKSKVGLCALRRCLIEREDRWQVRNQIAVTPLFSSVIV